MILSNNLLSGIANALKSILNYIISCSMFILAIKIVIPQLRKRNIQFKSYFIQAFDSIFRSQDNPQSKTHNKQTNNNSSLSNENRLNCIKDTLNFNLCSQSDLVKIIQDIQQMKKQYPEKEKYALSYNKMMFKTILQEKEDGRIIQLFSEFEFLNEILDKEKITLNIQQLEIDYLFDERLETYYTYQTNQEQNNRNNQIDNQIYNPHLEQQYQQQQLDNGTQQLQIENDKIQNKIPSIYIHKQLFVQFINFYNYNFHQFSFAPNSNLEYTQALLVQDQSYLNVSNPLSLDLPQHIIVFYNQQEFTIYTRTFLTLLLYIKTFNQKISPHINYLREYTLMDILLED